MTSLRVGCVQYLNARPLVSGWRGDVEFDHPSALCRRLARGDLDIALVSSFEFLRNPVYRIVDDVAISSDGPVYSVIVAHSGLISEIEEIELDPAAETSVNLLRCLLAELQLAPRLIGRSTSSTSPRHARLLIGDQAIRFRQENGDAFHYWDLGEQWAQLVDLPFVYALWLIRPEVSKAERVAEQLRKLRDQNLGKINNLIAQEKEFDPVFSRRYYRENVRFMFREREKQGLHEFYRRCLGLGLFAIHDLPSALELPLL